MTIEAAVVTAIMLGGGLVYLSWLRRRIARRDAATKARLTLVHRLNGTKRGE